MAERKAAAKSGDGGAYLTGRLIRNGEDGSRETFEPGTKVSEIEGLTDAEKKRLERLDLTGSKEEAEVRAGETPRHRRLDSDDDED